VSVKAEAARPRAFDDERDVLPRIERVAFIAKKLISGELGTQVARMRALGQGTLFSEHRRYTAGDDLRFIDWNAVARFDEVFLRVFEPEDSAPATVILDTSPSMRVDGGVKLVQGALVAATFSAIGVLVLAGTNVVDTGSLDEVQFRGKDALVKILKHFSSLTHAEAAAPKPGASPLRDAVRRVSGRPQRGPLVIVTDGLPLADLESALEIRGRRPTLVLHVVDPEELNPGLTGLRRLTDPETGRVRRVLVTRALRRRYVDLARERMHEIEGAVGRAGAGYTRVNTAAPFDASVLNALRRGTKARLVGV
jgi:uncharacterized protein (DUF58 family)